MKKRYIKITCILSIGFITFTDYNYCSTDCTYEQIQRISNKTIWLTPMLRELPQHFIENRNSDNTQVYKEILCNKEQISRSAAPLLHWKHSMAGYLFSDEEKKLLEDAYELITDLSGLCILEKENNNELLEYKKTVRELVRASNRCFFWSQETVSLQFKVPCKFDDYEQRLVAYYHECDECIEKVKRDICEIIE